MNRNARELAHEVLVTVETTDRGSQEALAAVFAGVGDGRSAQEREQDVRSRALTSELVYGVLRYRRLLDHTLASFAPRGLPKGPPALLAALRLAAYQLLFMPKIPDYAAVDGAVALVKQLGAARAGRRRDGRSVATIGFANGLLRALAARRSAPPPPPPGASPAALGVRHSLPDWIAARLVALLEDDTAPLDERLALENSPAPLILRANRLRVDVPRLLELLRDEGAEAEALASLPGAVFVTRAGEIFRGPAFAGALWLPQSMASQRVVSLLDLAPGQTVLDLCAGVGVKTTQIAEAVGSEGRVDAIEREPAKVAQLEALAQRWGTTWVRAAVADLLDDHLPFEKEYDRVLLDAPCTALGLLRRRPEVRWRRTEADVRERAVLQAKLLDAAAARLAPGGRLVYAVCSFTEEEGPAQIRRLLAKRPDLSVAPPPTDPALAARLDGEGFLRTGPETGDDDRFFAACITRA